MRSILLCFMLGSLTFSQPEETQHSAPFTPNDFKKYICYFTQTPIVIDGKLDDAVWQDIPFSSNFVDIEGSMKPAPKHKTKVKMTWDANYLYVAALLEEPHIWATYTQRESIIFHENDFELFIDPEGDTHNYYEIEINALNTVWDLMLTKPYRDKGKPLSSWNLEGMQSAVFLDGTLNDPTDEDRYWSVELSLPWSGFLKNSAQKPPVGGDLWRMNFSRVQWELDVAEGRYTKRKNPETGNYLPEYNWVWSPQGVINMHRPETWGYVLFSTSDTPDHAMQFTLPPGEWYKWELRKIYYAQKRYNQQHGHYAVSSGQLDFQREIDRDLDIAILPDPSGYKASITPKNSTLIWEINAEGLCISHP